MRIVGLCIVGPGEGGRYLSHTLASFKRLCDHALLVLNNVDYETLKIAGESGFALQHDNREWGLYQREIKQDALKRLRSVLRPDWVLALDADEEIDPAITREDLEELTEKKDRYGTKEVAWYFWFIQKWDNEQRHLPSMGIWDVRFFQYNKELGFEYENKQMHCGMAPKWAYQYGFYAPVLVIHRGLMNPDDRKKKVERYKKYDPKQIYCSPDYYSSLEIITMPEELSIEKERSKILSEVEGYSERIIPKPQPEAMKKVYKVLRKVDGAILDIEDKYLADTLNQGGKNKLFELVSQIPVIVGDTVSEAPIQQTNPLQCGICGRVAASNLGLRSHARTHKDKS